MKLFGRLRDRGSLNVGCAGRVAPLPCRNSAALVIGLLFDCDFKFEWCFDGNQAALVIAGLILEL